MRFLSDGGIRRAQTALAAPRRSFYGAVLLPLHSDTCAPPVLGPSTPAPPICRPLGLVLSSSHLDILLETVFRPGQP